MFKNTYFEENLQTTTSEKLFFVVRPSQYCEFKVEHAFPNQSFSPPSFDHHHALPGAFYFISALVALGLMQLLKNNTDGIYIHIFNIQMPINFLMKSFLKTTSCRLTYIILMNRIRLLIEAVAQRCSVKKAFSEFSLNSQENTCARVSFLIKLQATGLQLY